MLGSARSSKLHGVAKFPVHCQRRCRAIYGERNHNREFRSDDALVAGNSVSTGNIVATERCAVRCADSKDKKIHAAHDSRLFHDGSSRDFELRSGLRRRNKRKRTAASSGDAAGSVHDHGDGNFRELAASDNCAVTDRALRETRIVLGIIFRS